MIPDLMKWLLDLDDIVYLVFQYNYAAIAQLAERQFCGFSFVL
jgi:hypothetical protein